MFYCKCLQERRQWYGIANIVVAQPETEEDKKWVHTAAHYAGLVLCETCGGTAPYLGGPVGQMSITGAAHILKCAWERLEKTQKAIKDANQAFLEDTPHAT